MGNGLFINGKKDGQAQVTFVKAETISDDSRRKENGKTWEFLLVAGPSPPPVWEPNVCEKFMGFFMTLETFLVYTKKFTFIGGYFGWSKITW